jgi:hypothetical protein
MAAALRWPEDVPMATSPKKPAESVSGRFTALPHSLLDSVAFVGASHMARSLLYELMRQHNPQVGSTGKGNNGHLHLSCKWLRSRGWSSNDGIQKAKQELLARGLIIKTREGGLNNGADKYAVTWMAITNFVGLDIQAKDYHPGAYQLLGPFAQPPAKRQPGEPPPTPQPTPSPVSRNSPAHVPPSKCHTAYRNSPAPCTGTVNAAPAPHTGTRAGIFGTSTAPRTGNNVTVTTVPTAGEGCPGVAVVVPMAASSPEAASKTRKPTQKKRIVGKAGKSGRPKSSLTMSSEHGDPTQPANSMAYASLRAADVSNGIAWATPRMLREQPCCGYGTVGC